MFSDVLVPVLSKIYKLYLWLHGRYPCHDVTRLTIFSGQKSWTRLLSELRTYVDCSRRRVELALVRGDKLSGVPVIAP